MQEELVNKEVCAEKHRRVDEFMEQSTASLKDLGTQFSGLEKKVIRAMAVGATLLGALQFALQLFFGRV